MVGCEIIVHGIAIGVYWVVSRAAWLSDNGYTTIMYIDVSSIMCKILTAMNKSRDDGLMDMTVYLGAEHIFYHGWII
jgi:hypothetical protein